MTTRILTAAATALILTNPTAAQPPQPVVAPQPEDDKNWKPLFDGKTLEGWKITQFGGQGKVWIEDERLYLGVGSNLTGVTTTRKDIPRINYEVSLEAMRYDGRDFFCGLTFPVKKDPCTLIVGGWGGGVCGLSSLNGFDAAENATTTYREFENKRWYRIRLRVTENRITAWLDGKELIDQDITNREISIRPEVELSKPFGFASWQTTAALRNIRIRKLDPDEIRPPDPK